MRVNYRGFTLLEILVVVALTAMIASFSAYQGIGSYQQAIVRIDAETTDSSLRYARSLSMHGVCADPSCRASATHGVRNLPAGTTVFEGTSYEERSVEQDQFFPFLGSEAVPSSSDILFLENGEVLNNNTYARILAD
jgi:prepilin-type N-terminal cleavage/methylation domain-containing protein